MNDIKPMTNVVVLKKATLGHGSAIVLSDVDLILGQGEMAYLVGRTGAGKSTLLKTLYGELRLLGGEGNVAGHDLKGMNWENAPLLRRKLGIVFQDFNLLADRSVLENLLFVLRATDWSNNNNMKKRALEVLGMVGMADKAYKMPHAISGGEQQRVVIARALLNGPEVILADEPTGNLDPETSDEVMLLIRKICRDANTAALIATHDLQLMEKFPARVIRCANGQLYSEHPVGF